MAGAVPILTTGSSSGQSIYEVRTSQAQPIGTRGVLPDGRVFFYGVNTSASTLTAGQVMVRPDLVANHQNLATATNAMVVGATTITDVTLGATAATANQYQNGYLLVTDAGGQGHTYQIRSHAAIASAGTGDFSIFGSVAVASDASTTVSLLTNPYSTPQVSNTDQLDVPVGVPVTDFGDGSTNAQYGWFQTWGDAAILCDEAIATVGQAVVIGSSTAGAAEEDDTATTVSQEFILGYSTTVWVDTEYQGVSLRIAP